MPSRSYSKKRIKQIRAEFAAKRRRQLFTLIPALIAIVAFAWAESTDSGKLLGIDSGIWMPIGIASVAVLVIVATIDWRCPACDASLGRAINPDFCPKCGVQLQD